jgi:hypothetical protein
MAISGHKSLAEVERYTKDADQTRMAERAIQRTEFYTRRDQVYTRDKKSVMDQIIGYWLTYQEEACIST